MSKPKIGIVVGSVRPNRFADHPTKWISEIAGKYNELEFEIVDVKDYPMPFFNEVTSPLYAPSASEAAQRWQKKIASLDGFIFIAAEYSRGPTASLKNALDYAYTEWNRKPAAFVGYGGVGGARAIEQLRLHAVELQMAPTRNGVHIVWADMMQVMQGDAMVVELDDLNAAANNLLTELTWWAKVLKTAREADAIEAKAA